MTEFLMGHEGYLTDAYRRYSEGQLAELYLKGEGNIMVFGTPVNQKRFEELEDQLERTQKELEQRDKDIAELKEDMKLFMKIANKMEKQIRE